MITPIEKIKIKTAEEADRALASLAAALVELQTIDAGLKEAVGLAQARAAEEAALPAANARAITAALEKFLAENRDELCGKKKSLKLTCGELGYRVQRHLEHPDWGKLAEVLEAAGAVNYLRAAPPEIDKAALGKLDNEDLAEFGLRRVAVEKFYAKPAEAVLRGYGHEL